MELIIEVERLTQQAVDLRKEGSWLRAAEKHQRAAQLLDQINTGVDDRDALAALYLISEHHKRLGQYLTTYTENKRLQKAAKKINVRLFQGEEDMNQEESGRLNSAFKNLARIAESVDRKLKDIEQSRKHTDVSINLQDFAYNPMESVIFVDQSDVLSSRIHLRSQASESFEDLKKSNDELKKSLTFLYDENQKLRDVLHEFQEEYRDNLFLMKTAIDMANIRGVSGAIHDEKIEVADAKEDNEHCAVLQKEVEILRREHKAAMDQVTRLERHNRMLESQLESEVKQRQKLQKEIHQHKRRWETIKQSARDRERQRQDI